VFSLRPCQKKEICFYHGQIFPMYSLFMVSHVHSFLPVKTPNFAIDMKDVPQSPRPLPSSSMCLTLWHFIMVSSSLMQRFVSNNLDAQPPTNWSTWPPPVILDVLYANTTLKWWATQPTIDLIYSWTRESYWEQEVAGAWAKHTAECCSNTISKLWNKKGRGWATETCLMCFCFFLSLWTKAFTHTPAAKSRWCRQRESWAMVAYTLKWLVYCAAKLFLCLFYYFIGILCPSTPLWCYDIMLYNPGP
jgi:hypothetical protein